jgi:hypothetical protein
MNRPLPPRFALRAPPARAGTLLFVTAALAAAMSPVPAAAAPTDAPAPPPATAPCAAASAPPALVDLAPASGDAVWSEVYAVAARRADAGSAEAARLALQMHRLGPIVYGMRFDATARQVQRWQRRALCGGEPCDNEG